MPTHLPSAIERQLDRFGSALTVRRKAGTLDPVTSTRPSTTTTDVTTRGVFRKRVQRSAKGDPLSSEERFYLVPAAPFTAFVPRDADVVIDGANQLRVQSVRARGRSGVVVAYELHVGGVAG